MKTLTNFLLPFLAFCFFINQSKGQDSWTEKAPFGGHVRRYAAGFSIGTKGYLGSGDYYDGTYYYDYSDFWEYDPSTNTWTRKADIGGGLRTEAVGFSIGNKGFICTGDTSGKDLEEYDPTTNKWLAKSPFAGTARDVATAFSIGGKGYVGLGIEYANDSAVKDFWEYDTASNKWTRIADFPGGVRYGAMGFSIGNKGFVACGAYYNSQTSTLYNDLWEYDPGQNTWTQKASMGSAGRYAATGFCLNNQGFVGFGYLDKSGISNDLWSYDTTTDAWTQMSYCDTGYTAFAPVSFVINNYAYVGTGENFWGTYLGYFYQYSSGPSAIDPENRTQNFSVYPNPNTGNFVINSSYPIESYEVCDMNGKQIYNNVVQTADNAIHVDLSLPNGLYLVRIISKTGTSIKKVMVTNN